MVNLGKKRSCGRDDVLIPHRRGSRRVHSIPQRSIARQHRDTEGCNGVGCRDDWGCSRNGSINTRHNGRPTRHRRCILHIGRSHRRCNTNMSGGKVLFRGFPNRVPKQVVKLVLWSSRVQWLDTRNNGKSVTNRCLRGNIRWRPLVTWDRRWSRWIRQDDQTKTLSKLTIRDPTQN